MELKSDVRVFANFASSWIEKDLEYAKEMLSESGNNWVYDTVKNVICFFEMGNHIGAVRFLVREFYGYKRISKEDVPKWQEIVRNNMILFGAKVHDPSHYVRHLPKEIRGRSCFD